jgi:hypothetical protein
MEVLGEVERQWTRPTGTRRVVQETLVIVGNLLPSLAFLVALALQLWRFLGVAGERYEIHLADFLMPLVVLLGVLVLLHLLISLLLPLRWEKIRDDFHAKLEEHVERELESVYQGVPGDVAKKLDEEKKRIDKLTAEAREVASWLEKREQSASVAGLYGR